MSKADLPNSINGIMGSSVTLGLNCDAASNVALQVTDNRASSAITNADFPANSPSNMADSELFGLGKDSASNNIGALGFMLTDVKLDSASAYIMQSTDKSTWTTLESGILQNNGYISVAATSSATSPSSFTTASVTLTPGITLFEASRYPSGEETTLDGSVTFTVNYL
ncbi:DUF1120 domain-containing protein [Hafnia psychrotolerans]|nr:DUF1120 domain-containing protein [Hafnia psychrotolerans]